MKKTINRNKSMLSVVSVPLLLLYASSSLASVSSDLNNFFNNLGFAANVTAPNAYEGQQAGYYTGGSLFARSQVRNVPLASIQLPNIKAGCGGIDFFAGGFSFIQGEQLIRMAKSVLNEAPAYGFHLALATISPMVESKLGFLNKWVSDINRFNLNSCEMAATVVGGVWPKNDLASQRICETIGDSQDIFTDRVRARHQCGNARERMKTLSQFENTPPWADLIPINTNIAWDAIQKNSFLSADQILAEFFMSLSGSIIFTTDAKGDNDKKTLDALGADRNLLNVLLNGGEAQIYQCDEASKCLNPELKPVTINQGLRDKILRLLGDMVSKINNDGALDDDTIDFLNATAFPIFKLLMVELSYTQGQLFTDINRYADVISLDLLYQYLTENMRLIKQSARNLQMDEQLVSDFISNNINATLATLNELKNDANLSVGIIMEFIKQSQSLEQALAGRLGDFTQDSFAWARGL
ncbi:MAG: conjugal transfer protein TraH [Gammaproteobacteria bacterium]